MIRTILSNTAPYPDTSGGLGFLSASKIEDAEANPAALADVCLCGGFSSCQYSEIAFSDASGEWRKNDSSSFLFNLYSSTGAIAMELWKDGAKAADINDNSYGTYYAPGDFPLRPYYAGFIADWLAIATAFGHGLYQLRATITRLGAASSFESRVFRSMPYSNAAADGTVRLEAYQSGQIVGGIDYSNLLEGGWPASFRIPGRFGDKKIVLSQDSYQSSDYTIQQIRDEAQREYRLEAALLPAIVGNWLTEDALLANSLLVTDYNLANAEQYNRLPVRAKEVAEAKEFWQAQRRRYIISFTDAAPRIIKRNF